jgi:hypothetical protein
MRGVGTAFVHSPPVQISSSRNKAKRWSISPCITSAFIKDVRGPGGVVILVTWLVSVVLVVTFADSNGRLAGIGLLAFFIAAYFAEVRREAGNERTKKDTANHNADNEHVA